jgi:hypothetical protein
VTRPRRPSATMIMNYVPLIFATAAMLAVFAFAAEASSG